MDEFLKLLASMYKDLRDRVNEGLSKLPELDKAQMASDMGYALNQIKWAGERAIEGMKGIDEKLKEIEVGVAAEIEKQVKAGVETQLQQMLTAGELVKKADVDAALESARNQAAEGVRLEVRQAAEKEAKRTERMGVLQSKFGFPAEVAASVSAEVLDAEDFDAAAVVLKGRLDKLAGLRITSPASVKDFLSHGVNAEGIAEFDKRVAFQESLLKEAGAAAPGKPPFVGGTGERGAAPVCAIV